MPDIQSMQTTVRRHRFGKPATVNSGVCQECGKLSIFPKHYAISVCVACRTRMHIASGLTPEVDSWKDSKDLTPEEIEECEQRRREVDAVNFLAGRLGVTTEEVWRRLKR